MKSDGAVGTVLTTIAVAMILLIGIAVLSGFVDTAVVQGLSSEWKDRVDGIVASWQAIVPMALIVGSVGLMFILASRFQ